MTWQRVALIGLGSVALFFAVAFLDWLRSPDDRSHLGRFIQSIIEGDALDIVVRKGQQNWSILLGNAPLTLLVPAALLFVIYVLARPTSWGSRGLGKSAEKAPDAAGRPHRPRHHADDRLPHQRLRHGDPRRRRDRRGAAHRQRRRCGPSRTTCAPWPGPVAPGGPDQPGPRAPAARAARCCVRTVIVTSSTPGVMPEDATRRVGHRHDPQPRRAGTASAAPTVHGGQRRPDMRSYQGSE